MRQLITNAIILSSFFLLVNPMMAGGMNGGMAGGMNRMNPTATMPNGGMGGMGGMGGVGGMGGMPPNPGMAGNLNPALTRSNAAEALIDSRHVVASTALLGTLGMAVLMAGSWL